MSSSVAARVGVGLLVLGSAVAPACGMKGPPLPPLRRVPAAVDDLSAERYADRVFVRFTVPSANVEGPGPANLAVVELFALTSGGALTPVEAQSARARSQATLVSQHRVRRPLPPAPDGVKAAGFQTPGEVGVAQGAAVDVVETLTAESRVPVSISTGGVPGDSEARATVGQPLVAPTAETMPRRYYFAVGVTDSGRYGEVSAIVPVPLGRTSSAPTGMTIAYDESGLLVKWSPPPDAQTAPESAVTEDVLPSRPLVAPAPPTRYDIFDASAAAETDNLLVRPVPLTAAPLTTPELRVPGITYGRERCFSARAVDQANDAFVRGPASPPVCVTPRDTFAPGAPQNLATVAGSGSISLIWEPNSEPDLAGYIVLRGDATGGTLAALTPTPIRETTFRDTSVRPGVRYVYAVVAVDAAIPQNVSAQSARVEETARE